MKRLLPLSYLYGKYQATPGRCLALLISKPGWGKFVWPATAPGQEKGRLINQYITTTCG